MTYKFNVTARQTQAKPCYICGGIEYQMVTVGYCDADGDIVENVKSQQCKSCGKVTPPATSQAVDNSLSLIVPKASEHLPAGLAYSYEQARSIVATSGLASLLLLRAVIEGLCKYANIHEEGLYAMIEQLARKAKLPYARKAVLQRLRELGNDIAHKVSEIQEVAEDDLLDAFRSINIVADALAKEQNGLATTRDTLAATPSTYSVKNKVLGYTDNSMLSGRLDAASLSNQELVFASAPIATIDPLKRDNLMQTVNGCTKSISANRSNYLLWSNRGLAYYQLGMYDAALADLLKALELDTSDPVTYLRLGDIYKAINQFDAAVDSYKQAYECYPPETAAGLGKVCVKIGDLYLDMERYDEATEWFVRSVQVNPDAYIGYYKCACISVHNNDSAATISWLRQAGEHGGCNLQFGYDFTNLQSEDETFEADFNALVKDGVVATSNTPTQTESLLSASQQVVE